MAATSAPSDYSQQTLFKIPKQASTVKQQHSSKSSCSNIFLKSLIVMLVLVVIPLFPSQAPDFITQSIVTQFWELFHLLFIGIAVCYGLFCKRSSTKIYTETHSRFESSDVYAASGISNVASIFDNGLENFCGSDEKRVIPNWDSQFLHYQGRGQERFELVEGEKVRSFLGENGAQNFCGSDVPNWDSQFLNYEYGGQERSNLDEGEKSRSFSDVDGVESTGGLNEKEVSQVWNSQYFVGESMVVVANRNYGIEKVGHIDHKPLGLPVRSLRNRLVNAGNPEFIHENTVNSGGSSGSIGYEVRGEKIRGMAPINLGRKFEEASGPRQISWRSRSQKRELGGMNTVRPPSHTRPHSVGQLEFGHLKSRSFSRAVSSRTSPTSSSPSIISPSSSYSSENGSVKMEMPQSEPHYLFESISSSASEQTGTSIGEAAVLTSKVNESSNQSFPEMNVQLRNDYEEDATKMKMNPSSVEASQVQGHLHSEPHCDGETELGHLEPWSFWNRIRAHIVSNSSSPRAISPMSAASPEMPSSRKEELESLKNVKPPSVRVSQPTARSVNDAAAFVASKTRQSTVGSSSEFDTHCTSNDKLKDVGSVNDEEAYHTSKSRAFSIESSSEITMHGNSKLKHASKDLKEDSSYTQKESVNSLVSDVKQRIPAKTLSRGKSVRTFRSRRSYIGRSKRKEGCPKESGDINEVNCDEFDSVSSMKFTNSEGHANPLVNSQKDILDNCGPIPSSAFSESEHEAKQLFVNTDSVESKENSECKGNSENVLTNYHMSSDEEADFNLADDADLGSEVDRKAGEFIAKFREQIRLQKIESFRRTSG
ncbi:uncharacterized protein LOC107802238 [Nicotiana tabacum]|uniref:Uncharacterized protein LOC107802238 n=1 Tax=Nicotiana tabacum TaxID=4097 RepID=A0A1S4AWW9_TOBAC|nr:PREDICTED: uncharacterized protein LOC107802238 [Nicotiana tabacum]